MRYLDKHKELLKHIVAARVSFMKRLGIPIDDYINELLEAKDFLEKEIQEAEKILDNIPRH